MSGREARTDLLMFSWLVTADQRPPHLTSPHHVSASPRQEDGDHNLQESCQEIQENVAEEGDEAITADCQHWAKWHGDRGSLLGTSAGQDGGLDNLAGGEADISNQSPRSASQDGRRHESDGPAVGLQPGHDERGGGPDDDAESLNVELISLAVICDILCFAFNFTDVALKQGIDENRIYVKIVIILLYCYYNNLYKNEI